MNIYEAILEAELGKRIRRCHWIKGRCIELIQKNDRLEFKIYIKASIKNPLSQEYYNMTPLDLVMQDWEVVI